MNSVEELERWLKEAGAIVSTLPSDSVDDLHSRVLQSARPIERGVWRFIAFYSIATCLVCLAVMLALQVPIAWMAGSLVGSWIVVWTGYFFVRWIY